MRSSLLAALFLAACGDDSATSATASGQGGSDDATAVTAAGGTGGAADGGGPASSTTTTTTSQAATSTASSAGGSASSSAAEASSSSAGAGGTGGEGGQGGAGCVIPECNDDARASCRPECDFGADCDVDVCLGGEPMFSLGLVESLIQIPPVVVQYDACEACDPSVLYSIVGQLPDGIEEGCVVVLAPPGITWSVGDDPTACPGAFLGCERAPFGPDSTFVHIVVTEPSDFPRDVRIISYDADNCVGVPAPTCDDLGCFGAG